MIQDIQLVCSPEEAASYQKHLPLFARQAGVSPNQINSIQLLNRSIDARSRNIKVNLGGRLFIDEEIQPREILKPDYKDVSSAKRILIIGCGPAGMFAAMRCIELGLKPIVIERGKDVKSRRRDLKAINRDHTVNPESNYCFGEGGAGTYSDGKLYTRSKKRGSVKRVLDILVNHGAVEDILVDAHPHIGTNKLPKVVENMRETILHFGGEIHFDTRMDDLILKGNRITGIRTQNGDVVDGEALILATGHSARDVFELLHRHKIDIEAKPFAMGVRVEHSQELIDKIQYHGQERGDLLPAASYKLVEQVQDRGVYSFCMCPGGFIVPAATAGNELVVNGMSPSKRDNKFANSGIVVAIELSDLRKYSKHGPLAGLAFQQETEQAIWKAGGSDQTAPAQRLTDFVKGRTSSTLNDCSYMPGLHSSPMHDILPSHIGDRLRQAFPKFGQKMRGYYTEDANIVGIESRTSSPVRIPRKRDTLQHPQIDNLFPCAEGAGYAGGIVSAGIDGENCAEAVLSYLSN
ncbi:NAD(P)/FAD-dependent oxidoreductase [Owenweeksia hongkongensis]|uniref:NAD(P)/FAD-dependent oxidoreductase n=1 Tax=Owenweeksia hongkongensis TaxID=253245 RepID=UPI003A8DA9E0